MMRTSIPRADLRSEIRRGYVEGFVEGCLKRICKDDNGEDVLRAVWEDGDDRDFFLELLNSGCEVRRSGGQPPRGSDPPKKRFEYSLKGGGSKNRNLR